VYPGSNEIANNLIWVKIGNEESSYNIKSSSPMADGYASRVLGEWRTKERKQDMKRRSRWKFHACDGL